MIINLISWIVFGALAGWVASMIMKTNASQGLLMDIIVGIVGAVLGGFLAGVLGLGPTENWSIWGFIVAVVGAVLLLAILRAVRR